MDENKKQLLKDIFWEMNTISSRTETKTETVITETDDGHGNIVQTETTVTQTIYILPYHTNRFTKWQRNMALIKSRKTILLNF